jgi:hypothetical protein
MADEIAPEPMNFELPLTLFRQGVFLDARFRKSRAAFSVSPRSRLIFPALRKI